MGRDSLGQFEQLVLLAVLRLRGDAYAVPVIDEIERQTGRTVSHSAVHVALKRMETRGLVTSSLGEPTAQRGGRAKRYYRATATALEQLQIQRDALLSMWDGIEETP